MSYIPSNECSVDRINCSRKLTPVSVYQEAPLYQELHPHASVCVVHPEGHLRVHQGRGPLRSGRGGQLLHGLGQFVIAGFCFVFFDPSFFLRLVMERKSQRIKMLCDVRWLNLKVWLEVFTFKNTHKYMRFININM